MPPTWIHVPAVRWILFTSATSSLAAWTLIFQSPSLRLGFDITLNWVDGQDWLGAKLRCSLSKVGVEDDDQVRR